MEDVHLLLIGAGIGVIGDELWRLAKRKCGNLWRSARTRRFKKRSDAVIHARNILLIYEKMGLSSSLYVRPTAAQERLPLLPVPDDRWAGRIEPAADAPFSIASSDREVLPFSKRRVALLKKQGLNLWDGSILFLAGYDANRGVLSVGICNYFAYVEIGARILAESTSVTGGKRLLTSNLRTFENALTSGLKPIAVAVAATCVFETRGGPMVALHQRSDETVNARGLVGIAPVFGLESNVIAGRRSRYGIVVYNLIKEILEEFFGQEEVCRSADQPMANDPDSIFKTRYGQRLVDELESGRMKTYITGAVVDPSDGSLILSALVHFTSPDYLELIYRAASGSWEAQARPCVPKIELCALNGEDIDSRMSIDVMMATSIYSLDRARETMEMLSEGRRG